MLEGLGPKGEAVFTSPTSVMMLVQSSHKSVFHLGRNWVRLKRLSTCVVKFKLSSGI